ncbi:MAG: hypothetical protein EOP53_07460, partial [Sphingobacteriales bacterium]
KPLLLLLNQAVFCLSTTRAFTCLSGFAQNRLPAQHLLDSVITKALKEKKNVFVSFSASWCGPCKDLKRGIYDVYNIQFFEKNYVVLELYGSEVGDKKINENAGANEIILKYDGDTSFLPYWMILNSKGIKLLDNYVKSEKNPGKRENIGFSYNPESAKKFLAAIKKTSKLTDAELQLIDERFRQLSRSIPED